MDAQNLLGGDGRLETKVRANTAVQIPRSSANSVVI